MSMKLKITYDKGRNSKLIKKRDKERRQMGDKIKSIKEIQRINLKKI